MKKVLFVDTVHPVLKERLIELGYECHDFQSKDLQEFLAVVPNYFGLVIRSKFTINKEVVDKATQLKFIARSGAGMENIDLNYCAEKGIACINSPEGNKAAVAEHALGMLLMLLNRLKITDSEVRSGLWQREENRGYEIEGKTFGVIGYGNMGSAFVQRLQGFGCKVLVYDKYKKNYAQPWFKACDSIDELYAEVDFISIHTNYTPETHYMANEAFFNAFKKPIYFINTARGKNLKTSALVEALKAGKVKGACLDVLEFEPSSFEQVDALNSNIPQELQYLLKSNQVVLSPHVAGWTHESYYKLSSFLADKIKLLFHSEQ